MDRAFHSRVLPTGQCGETFGAPYPHRLLSLWANSVRPSPKPIFVGSPRTSSLRLFRTRLSPKYSCSPASPPPPCGGRKKALLLPTKFCPGRQGAPRIPAALRQLRFPRGTRRGRARTPAKWTPGSPPKPVLGSLPSPTSGGRAARQGGGSAPASTPSRASGATLGRLAPELESARRWGLSISRIDKSPLERAGGLVPSETSYPGQPFPGPPPAESRAAPGPPGSGARLSPAPPSPPTPLPPLWAGGHRSVGAELVAGVDATPNPRG